MIVSEPGGVRVLKDGERLPGATPLAITLTRSGQGGLAAPVMFEALASDPTQCPQARVFDHRDLTPDTLEFFMRLCPAVPISPDSVYRSEDVTDPPIRVSSPAVRYPDVLRRNRIGGHALVEFVVDTLGRAEPGSVRVVEAAPALFGPPAMEIVRASRFLPGHLDGRRVRVRLRMPVNFGSEAWRD